MFSEAVKYTRDHKFVYTQVMKTRGIQRGVSVVSRVMRKFVLALVEICRMGAGSRPLVTFQQAGCKGSRAAVRRSSCP